MFVNQVDGNGDFKVTNIISDNVNATTGTFTNLNTTTFSPVNVNATTIISNNINSSNGTIGILNSSNATIDTLNNTTLNTTGIATLATISSNSSTIGALTSNHIILPSNNNLSAHAELIKLQDELRIKSGTSGVIGFYNGTTSNMNYDGELNISSKITSVNSELLNSNINTLTAYNATIQKKLFIENNTNKQCSILHVNDNIMFYGSINNNLTPSNFLFATNSGGTDADIKLKIHKDKDEVEIKDLNITNAIKISQLLNIYYQAGVTLHEATISREPNSVKYIGDKSDTGGAHLEFYTDDGTDVKLKIHRDSFIVEVKNLTVTDDIISTTLYSTFIYSDEIDTDECIVNNELIIGTDSKIWSSASTFNYQSGTTSTPKQFKFMTGAPGEVVFFKSGLGKGVIETDDLILNNLLTSEDILNNNLLTSQDIIVNNEIEIGTDSKIWSTASTFQFQSGTTSTPKQYKFMTGSPGEVVYFKSGQGKGVIETDDINVTSINTTEITSTFITGTSISGNIYDNLLAGTNITLTEELNGKTTISTSSAQTFTTTAPLNLASSIVSVLLDTIPTINSTNLINSGNLLTEFATKQDTLTSTSNINVNDIISGAIIADDNIKSSDRAIIGNCGHGGGAFAYKDFMTTSNYALLQQPDGSTFVNCAVNKALHFRVGNAQIMTLNSSGYLGIGTGSPAFPLDVKGDSGNHGFSGRYFTGSSGTQLQYTTSYGKVTAYFQWDIVVDGAVGTSSDERIKKNIQDVSDEGALNLLRLIEPKTYEYIDTVSRTPETVYGFIAQQIKSVFPHATKEIRNGLPNIYEMGTFINNILTFSSKTTDLLEKDTDGIVYPTIVIYDEHDKRYELKIISIIDSHSLSVKLPDDIIPEQVFIHGQVVDNFITIDKSYISTITTSALQEIDRQLQAEKAKNVLLENKIANILARLDDAGI